MNKIIAIETLENDLKELKSLLEKEEQKNYENQPHKSFNKGDIVTNGKIICIVQWTENLSIGKPKHTGYMGADIITGHRGFITCRRDEFNIVKDDYYTSSHYIRFSLTGLEIEELKYTLGYKNVNPNDTKTKILSILNDLHIVKEVTNER